MSIITYRTEKLDYSNVFENIVNGTCDYLKKWNIKKMILGISGGIDSTVTAAICKEVYNRTNIELIGYSLPCSTNKDDENNAANLVGKEFCNQFKVVNIQNTFDVVNSFCESVSNNATPISQGNVKARLRMITLYDAASKLNGIVIDTDNLTENYLGFYTIHGDCCDFNPIGGLWKHEIYELAKWIGDNIFVDSEAIKASISLIPTDGNGVKEGGDLAQIAPNKTYNDVDEILHAWVGLDNRIKDEVLLKDFDYGQFKALCDKHSKEIVKMVIMRSIKSSFKRNHLPLVVDIFNGNVTDKEGKLI